MKDSGCGVKVDAHFIKTELHIGSIGNCVYIGWIIGRIFEIFAPSLLWTFRNRDLNFR